MSVSVMRSGLWLCTACAQLAVNGEHDPDASAEEDARREKEISDLGPGLVIGDGRNDFSVYPCDCCGDRAHGERVEFSILKDSE